MTDQEKQSRASYKRLILDEQIKQRAYYTFASRPDLDQFTTTINNVRVIVTKDLKNGVVSFLARFIYFDKAVVIRF